MNKTILLLTTTTLFSLAGCATSPDRVDGVTFSIEKASDGVPVCHYTYDPAKVTKSNWDEVGQRLLSAYGSKLDQCRRFKYEEAKGLKV
ncbi:hypothetical protein ACE02Y_13455 [Shewanella xiamenensis]|uniref:hypothetical protein n=1 Tax=Shewanella xiamenensis TaxID=332186 RepID=UPI00217B8E25|nr:hypothetical protein [Shewanella xiamenensis]MDH1627740.1 hypothetical protein [Shewanella xiamenensis]BDQ67295.1 hypothetical protein NUITMVS2_31070 [Shewanella xiamenensis]GLD79333.1 hypothetical protein NUITMVS3_37670 [Shewanella xiamenensis]